MWETMCLDACEGGIYGIFPPGVEKIIKIFLPRKTIMGRPRKELLTQTTTKGQARLLTEVIRNPAKQYTRTIKVKPIRFFEILLTNSDYTFESHVFDENGVEFIEKLKKGGEK